MNSSTTWYCIHVCVSIAGLILSSLVTAQVEWVVGSEDAKSGAGTSADRGKVTRRFAKLEQAVSKLKEMRETPGSTLPAAGIRIHILPGTYRLAGVITLAGSVGTHPNAPMVFAGPTDKSAVISGGRVLERHSKVRSSHVLERLPNQARENVVQFDLREEGITEFGPLIRRGFGSEMTPGQLELFFRGKPMTLARWPDDDYAILSAAPEGADQRRTFFVSKGSLKGLAQEPSLMAIGYWANDWAEQTVPVESVDAKTGKITLQRPGPQFGIKAGQRVFFQNALSELDSPGEWYLDRDSGILYFWPPGPIRKGDVEVSVLPSLVVMKGANNIRLSGITFEMARGDALVIDGGANIRVAQVTIRNVGGRAARASGTGHGFSDVEVYDTGEGGIYIWGGDRQTLAPGNLSVEYSRIRRFNRLSRTYRPAISIGGVGNRAVGNVISDGTHSAIIFYGNEHLIAFNQISRVALETGDVGAIYTGRDWTARGTVIRDNYLHDVRGMGALGSRGVYLDDQASGIIVRSNVFVRVERPVFVGGGRDNRVEGNLMVASSPAIHVDARGLTWQRELTADPQWGLRKRLSEIPYDRAPYRDRYPNLASILRDDPGAPKYNVIRGNIVVDAQPLELTHGADRWVKIESVIETGANLFRLQEAALVGKKPTDFLVLDSGLASRKELASLPLETMECVGLRWQQVDKGRAPDNCGLK